jgi:hypothetical protein
MFIKQNMQRKEKLMDIRNFISDMGMVIEKEIPEHEVFIVSSVKLGLKNLVIDLEDEQILFKLQLGTLKSTFDDVDGQTITRSDIEREFLKLNNPFYEGGMKTGQFALDETNEDILIFTEQEFLESMDLKSFQNVIEGFSEVLVDKIDFIQFVIESKEV